jgi:DNA-binding transcriptional MerR regulator
MKDETHLYFDLEEAAEICDISVAQIRAYVRAGVTLSNPRRPPRHRFDEIDLRCFRILNAFQRDLGVSPKEAVEFWHALMPSGGWCMGNDGISFAVDGQTKVRVTPGAIASQVARRLLAFDDRRLAGIDRESSVGREYREDDRGPRISLSSKSRQTPVIVPANVFHPQRLTNRAPKLKGHTS